MAKLKLHLLVRLVGQSFFARSRRMKPISLGTIGGEKGSRFYKRLYHCHCGKHKVDDTIKEPESVSVSRIGRCLHVLELSIH